MTAPSELAPWGDADRTVQIEDDNPESLAGDDVDFDPGDDGEGE